MSAPKNPLNLKSIAQVKQERDEQEQQKIKEDYDKCYKLIQQLVIDNYIKLLDESIVNLIQIQYDIINSKKNNDNNILLEISSNNNDVILITSSKLKQITDTINENDLIDTEYYIYIDDKQNVGQFKIINILLKFKSNI